MSIELYKKLVNLIPYKIVSTTFSPPWLTIDVKCDYVNACVQLYQLYNIYDVFITSFIHVFTMPHHNNSVSYIYAHYAIFNLMFGISLSRHSSVSATKKTKKDVQHTSVLFTGNIKLLNSAFHISKTTKPISTKFIYFLPYIYTTSHIKIEGNNFSTS